MVTSNSQGPKVEQIEDYLNSFFQNNYEYAVKMTPIFIYPGIEEIRNSNLIKELTLGIGLSNGVGNFISESQKDSTDDSLVTRMKNVFTKSREEFNCDSIFFTVKIDGNSKIKSLTKNNTLSFLNSISIDADCITSIKARYEDNSSERIEIADLKSAQKILRAYIRGSYKQISPDLLLEEGENLLSLSSNNWREYSYNYMSNSIVVSNPHFKLNLEYSYN